MKGRWSLSLVVLGFALLLGACLSPTQEAILNVLFSEMGPNVGQRFEARLFELGGTEVGREIVASIPGASFSIDFGGVIVGESYRLQFYADASGNGSYDAPPTDHAWELTVAITSESTSAEFTRTDAFTDIGWAGGAPVGSSIDGVVGASEYAHSFTDPGTGIRVSWQNDRTTLTMGLESPGTGWVAVGFDGTNIKEDANIIMAAVVGGQLIIEDQYGTGPFSHSVDAEQNVLSAAATETGGRTIVEFSIPLDSGDASDKPLIPGNSYPLLIAYNASSDDMTKKHSGAATTQFTLDP